MTVDIRHQWHSWKKTYGNPHKILSPYWREVKEWSKIKFGGAKAFRKFYNFLLKCESISGSQQWNAMDTPEMLCMLIAKLPGGLIDRWNRNVQAIRNHQFCRRRNSSNEWSIIFKRGTTWVYQASWKVCPCKSKKLRNCYTKADQKTVEQTVTVTSIKSKFCDGNHNLDDCQFYCEITVGEWSSFLKKSR